MAVQTGGPAAAARGEARRDQLAVLWRLASTTCLVAVFCFFAIAHFQKWQKSGDLNGLGLVLQESLFAVLFLLRRNARRTSSSPFDWIMALGGSYLILAVRPSNHAILDLEAVATALQFLGAGLAVCSLLTLGRSFGVVAADRGLKTAGPYGLVRHPIYASYVVTEIGYLLQNPTVWNLAIVLAANACQVGRIRAEERILAEDGDWIAYALRVRYRLIPGVY